MAGGDLALGEVGLSSRALLWDQTSGLRCGARRSAACSNGGKESGARAPLLAGVGCGRRATGGGRFEVKAAFTWPGAPGSCPRRARPGSAPSHVPARQPRLSVSAAGPLPLCAARVPERPSASVSRPERYCACVLADFWVSLSLPGCHACSEQACVIGRFFFLVFYFFVF